MSDLFWSPPPPIIDFFIKDKDTQKTHRSNAIKVSIYPHYSQKGGQKTSSRFPKSFR